MEHVHVYRNLVTVLLALKKHGKEIPSFSAKEKIASKDQKGTNQKSNNFPKTGTLFR